MGNSTETRLTLLRTAERLFAEHGVDAVSLTDIHAAAEQRNQAAVQYHFGDKKGLVYAIVERHSIKVQQRWKTMIDLLEARDEITLRALCEVLVRGSTVAMDDADNGIAYLLIVDELTAHRGYPLYDAPSRTTEGAQLLTKKILENICIPEVLWPLRMLRTMSMLHRSIGAYILLHDKNNQPPYEREIFVQDLIDALVAVVGGQPSAQTLAAIDEACVRR